MSEYVLMDPRAHENPDDAAIYVTVESIAEAVDYRRTFPDAVLVEMVPTHGDYVDFVVREWPGVKP